MKKWALVSGPAVGAAAVIGPVLQAPSASRPHPAGQSHVDGAGGCPLVEQGAGYSGPGMAGGLLRSSWYGRGRATAILVWKGACYSHHSMAGVVLHCYSHSGMAGDLLQPPASQFVPLPPPPSPLLTTLHPLLPGSH